MGKCPLPPSPLASHTGLPGEETGTDGGFGSDVGSEWVNPRTAEATS